MGGYLGTERGEGGGRCSTPAEDVAWRRVGCRAPSPIPNRARFARWRNGIGTGLGRGPSDSVRPHRLRVIEDRELVGSGRVDVRRIVHATAEEGAMEVDVETVSDESERSPPRYSDSEREGVDKKPGPRQSRPRKRARGRPRKDGTGPFKPASPTNEELVRDAFGGHVPTLRPVDVVPLIGRM